MARIVTVWLDETSDPIAPDWIVDTDSEEGGESIMLKVFDSRAKATMFAEHYALRHGLKVRQLPLRQTKASSWLRADFPTT